MEGPRACYEWLLMEKNHIDSAELIARIERAYADSGNTLGWRLLASPIRVLEGAEVAFIGMNPGGRTRPQDHGEFAMAAGSAYVVEEWAGAPAGQSPLQRQVRALFAGLGVAPEDVLAGNLVPFRSPDWGSLHHPDHAVRFGMEIWREILDAARPKLIVGMGTNVTCALTRLLDVRDIDTIAVGWGKVRASRGAFKGGTLVGLPHLSRFGIMTRPTSMPAIRRLFEGYWQG